MRESCASSAAQHCGRQAGCRIHHQRHLPHHRKIIIQCWPCLQLHAPLLCCVHTLHMFEVCVWLRHTVILSSMLWPKLASSPMRLLQPFTHAYKCSCAAPSSPTSHVMLCAWYTHTHTRKHIISSHAPIKTADTRQPTSPSQSLL